MRRSGRYILTRNNETAEVLSEILILMYECTKKPLLVPDKQYRHCTTETSAVFHFQYMLHVNRSCLINYGMFCAP